MYPKHKNAPPESNRKERRNITSRFTRERTGRQRIRPKKAPFFKAVSNKPAAEAPAPVLMRNGPTNINRAASASPKRYAATGYDSTAPKTPVPKISPNNAAFKE